MRASIAFFVFGIAVLAGSAHARKLKQGVFTPPVIGPPMTPTSASSPWSNFTRDPKALYIGIKVLNSTVTGSDEECAVLCNDNQACEFFGWCPTNMTSGCGIPAANATYSSVVPPGGCILSWDDGRNRTALFIAFGKSVPFVSGQFSPQQNSTAAPSSSSGGAAGGGGGGGGVISPTVRKLMQGGSGSTTGVWSNYTQEQNRFNQGIDALPATTAQTAEECATACNNDPKCEFWSLCPPEVGAAGCEVPSFTPNASPTTVPAGTCLLSFDGTRDQMAYFLMLGQAVTFEAGKWNGSSASNPTTPDTTPSVIVPTIPGLVTNPTGPTSNTSAPGTPIPFVPPLTGDASASNNTSNSTLQGGTTNSSVLIYTSWVRAYGSAPAYCDVWNGTAFVKSESLGNGFLASGGNGTVLQPEVETYVSQLCAARSTAGATIATDLLAGGEAALNACVATLSSCGTGSQPGLLQDFADFINPPGNTDADKVLRYVTAWVAAAEQLGVATCVTLVTVDPEGKATVQTVHPATQAPIS